MKEKKKVKNSEKRPYSSLSISPEMHQRFRVLCLAQGIKPKEQLEILLKNWISEALKKTGIDITKVG